MSKKTTYASRLDAFRALAFLSLRQDIKPIHLRWQRQVSCTAAYPSALMALGGVIGAHWAYNTKASADSWLLLPLLFVTLIFLFGPIGIFPQNKWFVLLLTLLMFAMSFARVYDVRESAKRLLIEDHMSYTIDGRVVRTAAPANANASQIVIKNEQGVNIMFYDADANYQKGDHIRVTGKVAEFDKKRNPGGFDARDYHHRQGLHLRMTGRCQHEIIEERQGYFYRLFDTYEKTVMKARESMTSLWIGRLNDDRGGLVLGLLLGDTSYMSAEHRYAFRTGNFAYLTAVSGMHVAIICMFVQGLLRQFVRQPKVQLALLVMTMFLYGCLTLWRPGTLRAFLLMTAWMIAQNRQKSLSRTHVLYNLTILMQLVDPHIALQYSFLLSFSASLSILKLGNKIRQAILRLIHNKAIASQLALMLAAQIGTIIFLAQLDRKLSPSMLFCSLLSSYVATGLLIMIFSLSGPMLVFGQISMLDRFFDLALWLVDNLAHVMIRLAEQASYFSHDAIALAQIPGLVWLGMLLLFFTRFCPKGLIKKLCIGFCLAVVLLGLIQIAMASSDRPIATVVFADVGQGDSTIVVLEDQTTLIIDGGDQGQGIGTVIPILDTFYVRKPSICILTHLHRDHGMGLIEMAQMNRLDNIYTPYTKPNEELSELLFLQQTGQVEIRTIRKNDTIILNDHARADIIWPSQILFDGDNEDSAVVLLTLAETRILVMGDAGDFTESLMCASPDTMPLLSSGIDVLRVGHHGSKTATTDDFINCISPQIAVISVGHNMYGHPSDEVLHRLTHAGIPYFRTDMDGAVVIDIYPTYATLRTYLGDEKRGNQHAAAYVR